MNPELKKRLQSLGWSIGMMALALVIDFALQNLSLFNLPNEMTVALGLVLKEVSKALHNMRA